MTVSGSGGDAGVAGLIFLRLARDLNAKRAVERHLRRRARAEQRRCGGCFAYLQCCAENGHLQETQVRAEHAINQQGSEMSNAARARDEEVKQLSMEVERLQEQLKRQRADIRSDSSRSGTCPRAGRARLEEDAQRCRAEVLELQRTLLSQRAEIKTAQQQRLEADQKAERCRSQLSAHREAEQQLLRSCAELHAPASRFLVRFGRPALPPLGAAATYDSAHYAEWIKGLTAAFCDIYDELLRGSSQGSTPCSPSPQRLQSQGSQQQQAQQQQHRQRNQHQPSRPPLQSQTRQRSNSP